ncbi:MAG: hypothetical protein JRH20_30535 [Deltaproteobacteria bacterium]|nr:hypothetical protein [Deltaproteobacteria bacterium]
MRINGLEILGRQAPGANYYVSSRANLNAPFGSWTTTETFDGYQDGTTFIYEGSEVALVAKWLPTTPRILMLCTAPFLDGCVAQPIEDKATGTPIVTELDGPSVAMIAGGGLLMAFNNESEVLLAEPIDLEDLSKGWRSWSLPDEVNAIGLAFDDPALSPDGTVLVLNTGYDFWVSRRSSTDVPFAAPAALAAVNTSFTEHAPYFVEHPDGRLELFFTSDREGAFRFYHCMCVP